MLEGFLISHLKPNDPPIPQTDGSNQRPDSFNESFLDHFTLVTAGLWTGWGSWRHLDKGT